ncbi:hypothetical protein [Paraburkholderia sp. J8-2]|uniref:hypothetical protein n=1 Tax=Paraburkholderia sp. J8-2 TaxID=2805440 RepID=UPI002AB6F545|nr:hypothetical protein [Paraburkholderia sp. J8-2]
MQNQINRCLTGFGIAMLLYGPASYADGPPEAYDNGAPVRRGIRPDDYLVNADGAKEDPNARMSDAARAYRNGWIRRGNTDDRILKGVMRKQHEEDMANLTARSARAAPPEAPERPAPQYLPPAAPSYEDGPLPAQYAQGGYPQPVYAAPVYAAPPPAPMPQPIVQYVPVYASPPPMYQPVAAYAPPAVPVAPYPVVQVGFYGARAWWGGGYRRWR